MTSKNLFFKLSYEDLKGRLWTLALVILFFLFTFPVAAVYLVGENKEFYDAAEWVLKYQADIVNLISAKNGFLAFMTIVMAMVCGMTSFSYLNFKNKVDFYHSIPVKREKLYFSNYINGIWLVALPYAVFLIAGIGIAVSNGADFLTLFSEGTKGYAMHMTYYLLVYSTVVVVMMMTGNRVVGFMGILIFFSVVPFFVSVMESCFYTWFWTYSRSESFLRDFLIEFSPVSAYLNSVAGYEYYGIQLGRIAAALGAFAVLMALGLFLYKKRPSEAAGKAMAFPVTKPVIRIILVMLCSIFMEVFGWGLRNNLGWAIFCMLCGCIISHCVIEIIYNFDFKQLFGHKIQLLGCIVASLLILLVFRYDLFGYDKYVPEADKVSNVTVKLSRLNSWVDYGSIIQNEDGSYRWSSENFNNYKEEHMRITDPSSALKLAQAGIERNNEIRAKGGISVYDMNDENERDRIYTDVSIKYYLKGNRTASRNYHISFDEAEESIKALCMSEGYQKGTFPVLNQTGDETAYIVYRKNKNMGKESRLSKDSPELVSEILKTYQEEWMNRSWEELTSENPVGVIRFVKKEEVPAIEWAKREQISDYRYYYGLIGDVEYYPVYPSFEKTLELLTKNGVDTRDTLDGFLAESISVRSRRSGNDPVIFRDPKQIEEIMKHVVLAEDSDYNSFQELDYDTDMSIRFEKKGITREYEYYFKAGQIPEFVKQRIGE